MTAHDSCHPAPRGRNCSSRNYWREDRTACLCRHRRHLHPSDIDCAFVGLNLQPLPQMSIDANQTMESCQPTDSSADAPKVRPPQIASHPSSHCLPYSKLMRPTALHRCSTAGPSYDQRQATLCSRAWASAAVSCAGVSSGPGGRSQYPQRCTGWLSMKLSSGSMSSILSRPPTTSQAARRPQASHSPSGAPPFAQ